MKLKFLLPLLCGVGLLAPAQQVPPSAGNFVVEKNVAVPMRDGVILRADVLRPGGEGAFPVLVYRTPYGKEPALEEYTTFRHAVEHGYAVVVQDVRGRYASDGEFRPYENEGRDGYDTIEWAARQPWSNGAVGTFGLSYPGAVQWLAAVENPPHLKAMVPAMTFSSAQNFFYAGGLWDMSWIEWIWDNIAPDIRAKRNLPGPKTPDEAVAAWSQASPKMLNTVPLDQLQELRGIAPYYYDWLAHPYDDPWWEWCDLRNKYGRVHAAVLNFSGWYDDNYGPEGATTNFAGLAEGAVFRGDPEPHFAVKPDPSSDRAVGAWRGFYGEGQSQASARLGRRRRLTTTKLSCAGWTTTCEAVANGVEKEKPVRYFVMGDDQWRARRRLAACLDTRLPTI